MANYRASGSELRKSPKNAFAGFLAFLLLGGVAYGGFRVMNGMVSLRPTLDEINSHDVDIVIPGTDVTEPVNALKFTTETLFTSDCKNGSLILVNESFPAEHDSDNMVFVHENKNDYYYVRDLTVRLREETIDAFNQLATGFFKATEHRDLLIMNGYRSREQQRKLYEADLQKTGGNTSEFYNAPGASDLETGYALELRVYGGDFTGEGDYEWVLKHCADYGFVVRYPADKSDIVKAKDGNLILRYVGIPHSLYMYQNNLCLEEYLELLESHPYDSEHLLLRDAIGRNYEAYYYSFDPAQPEEYVTLPVPTERRFTVSGDNKHGFFVTMVHPLEDDSWNTTTTTDPVPTEDNQPDTTTT